MSMTFSIEDGDVVDLADVNDRARRYVVHVEPDPETSITDFDCYGTVEVTRNGANGPQRPASFDGSARVLDRGHISTTWWQNHPDDTDPDAAYDLVWHLHHEGFLQLGLELQEQLEDSRGNHHWVELATAWIGAVDSLRDREHRAELLTDLAADIDAQLGVTA